MFSKLPSCAFHTNTLPPAILKKLAKKVSVISSTSFSEPNFMLPDQTLPSKFCKPKKFVVFILFFYNISLLKYQIVIIAGYTVLPVVEKALNEVETYRGFQFRNEIIVCLFGTLNERKNTPVSEENDESSISTDFLSHPEHLRLEFDLSWVEVSWEICEILTGRFFLDIIL